MAGTFRNFDISISFYDPYILVENVQQNCSLLYETHLNINPCTSLFGKKTILKPHHTAYYIELPWYILETAY